MIKYLAFFARFIKKERVRGVVCYVVHFTCISFDTLHISKKRQTHFGSAMTVFGWIKFHFGSANWKSCWVFLQAGQFFSSLKNGQRYQQSAIWSTSSTFAPTPKQDTELVKLNLIISSCKRRYSWWQQRRFRRPIRKNFERGVYEKKTWDIFISTILLYCLMQPLKRFD